MQRELLNKLFGDVDQDQGYWWLTANPKIWSFADLKVGEEQSYTLYNENGHKRRIFQNFLDAKVGDVIIGYEANPVKKVVALAKITQANDGKSIYFEKTEGLTSPIEYLDLKVCSELEGFLLDPEHLCQVLFLPGRHRAHDSRFPAAHIQILDPECRHRALHLADRLTICGWQRRRGMRV